MSKKSRSNGTENFVINKVNRSLESGSSSTGKSQTLKEQLEQYEKRVLEIRESEKERQREQESKKDKLRFIQDNPYFTR